MNKEIEMTFKKLEVGIQGVFETENYKRYLRCMSKFWRYSVNNSMLILLQNPDSTYVTGASKWATMNRKICYGAKSIKILLPHPYVKEIEVTDEEGNKKMVERSFVYFTLGNVFDISQTEVIDGKDDGFCTICNEVNSNSISQEFIDCVVKVANCPVQYWNLKDNSKGFYSLKEDKIVIKKEMSNDNTLKTLFHEIAHKRLHSGENTKTRQVKEIEAESVSYVCMQHFGVESTEQYSFEYLASWSKGKSIPELKEILTDIQKQAKEIIDEVEMMLNQEGVQ